MTKKVVLMALTIGSAAALMSAPLFAKEKKHMNSSAPVAGYEQLKGGLQYQDTQVGTGAEAKAGETVTVHYTGTLYPDGPKFDSSKDRGQPFSFTLGAGQVIKGWDEGFAGMKVGGHRTLIIPAEMGYGSRGAGASIPPNATLKFDVELLGVQS